MRKVYLISFIFATVLNVGNAEAQQWDDLLQFANSPAYTISNPPGLNPGNLPSTNGNISVPLFNCVNGSLPTFTGFAAVPGCSHYIADVPVNIDEFARQGDLTALSGSLQKTTVNVYSGVAQALAMAGSTNLENGENFAVSMNIGTFGGQSAFAGAGVARLSEHSSFNAGITASTHGGPIGGRAGIRFGW